MGHPPLADLNPKTNGVARQVRKGTVPRRVKALGDCPLFFVYLAVLQFGQAGLVESYWLPHARQKTMPETVAAACSEPLTCF